MGFGGFMKSFFKSSVNPRTLTYDTLLTGMPAPGLFTYKAAGAEQAEEKKEKAMADADASIKQTEFEASAKSGLERLSLKRKRGFASSMLVDPVSSLGSGSTLGS
jgi:hypothetical protein